MQRATPFARARAMFAAVAAAMALSPAMQHAALAEIEPYQSRGKGKGGSHRPRSSHTVAADKRASVKARNRRKHKARA